MELIQLAVFISALLCSLVSGLVFSFAIVVMPGIQTMGAQDFLKSFKAMDLIIQNNQPVFMVVWLGSALVLFVTTFLGFWRLDGFDSTLLVIACMMHLFGVQLPTVAINVPLNNRLQSFDLSRSSESDLRVLAELFEKRWMRWNTFRTFASIMATTTLLALLVRI